MTIFKKSNDERTSESMCGPVKFCSYWSLGPVCTLIFLFSTLVNNGFFSLLFPRSIAKTIPHFSLLKNHHKTQNTGVGGKKVFTTYIEVTGSFKKRIGEIDSVAGSWQTL